MSDDAKDRARRWFKDPEGWSRSVAIDILALEASVAGLNTAVAALEASRPATPDSSPAGDGEALRAECERLRAENAALRQRLAAPIDVEAFRPEFEQWFLWRHHGMEKWELFMDGVRWLAARLNAAARKEVDGE